MYYQESSLNLCTNNKLFLQFQEKEKKDQPSQDPKAPLHQLFNLLCTFFSMTVTDNIDPIKQMFIRNFQTNNDYKNKVQL